MLNKSEIYDLLSLNISKKDPNPTIQANMSKWFLEPYLLP